MDNLNDESGEGVMPSALEFGLLPVDRADVTSLSHESTEGTVSLSIGLACKALTKFDGKTDVEEFLNSVDDLMDCLRDADRFIFIKIVRTHIIGEASMAIRGSDKTWETTRNILFEIFGEKSLSRKSNAA